MSVEIEDMLFREFQKITSQLGVGDVVASEAAQRCIAALPDMVQLEWWEPRQDNNYTHGAKTIFGTYYVGQCGGRSNAHAEFFHESGDIEQYLGPDRGSVIEAQQDARRHYASRILSAFGITEGADHDQ